MKNHDLTEEVQQCRHEHEKNVVQGLESEEHWTSHEH